MYADGHQLYEVWDTIPTINANLNANATKAYSRATFPSITLCYNYQQIGRQRDSTKSVHGTDIESLDRI